MLVEVNETSGDLSVYGTVDHSLFYDGEDSQWWGGETQVRRSIFMGNFVVALSAGGVTATNLTTLNLSDSVELDRVWPEYYSIWTDDVEEEAKEEEPKNEEPKNEEREGKDDDGKSTSEEGDRPDDDGAGAAPDSDGQ